MSNTPNGLLKEERLAQKWRDWPGWKVGWATRRLRSFILSAGPKSACNCQSPKVWWSCSFPLNCSSGSGSLCHKWRITWCFDHSTFTSFQNISKWNVCLLYWVRRAHHRRAVMNSEEHLVSIWVTTTRFEFQPDHDIWTKHPKQGSTNTIY